MNLAVTDLAALMVTEHVPVPLQAPLQPANVEPAPAVAVSITLVPFLKFAEHVPGQSIPAGLLVTVPLPVPDKLTVNAKLVLPRIAFTKLAALTVPIPVAESQPVFVP